MLGGSRSCLATGFLVATRMPHLRAVIIARLGHLPLVRAVVTFHRTALFCRNLDVLLAAAVPLDQRHCAFLPT